MSKRRMMMQLLNTKEDWDYEVPFDAITARHAPAINPVEVNIVANTIYYVECDVEITITEKNSGNCRLGVLYYYNIYKDALYTYTAAIGTVTMHLQLAFIAFKSVASTSTSITKWTIDARDCKGVFKLKNYKIRQATNCMTTFLNPAPFDSSASRSVAPVAYALLKKDKEYVVTGTCTITVDTKTGTTSDIYIKSGDALNKKTLFRKYNIAVGVTTASFSSILCPPYNKHITEGTPVEGITTDTTGIIGNVVVDSLIIVEV